MRACPSRTDLVQYGVSLRFKTPLPFQQIPNLWLLVADDRTPTDLSFLQARPDEEMDHRLAALVNDLTRLRRASSKNDWFWLLELFESGLQQKC